MSMAGGTTNGPKERLEGGEKGIGKGEVRGGRQRYAGTRGLESGRRAIYIED